LETVISVFCTATVAMQRRGKHVSAAKNQPTTKEELVETVLSTLYV
jgi:hypothetical protein